jgi:NAD(P)-dependent dehydrogenase (short-subunit alcohol dehydrogenase family)
MFRIARAGDSDKRSNRGWRSARSNAPWLDRSQMRISFENQTAIVTGGLSGIGAAVVECLREAGATVTIFDLPEVDVSDQASMEAAFSRVPEPDVVIANAGVAMPVEGGLIETPVENWRRTIDVNLTGVFHTVRLAGRRMKGRGGSIVVTASTNSFDGEATLAAYNASKAGVLGIVRTAANELGRYGIRVNAVCPGLIRTPLTRGFFSEPAYLREYFRHIALGRGGEAREVAQAAVFLASSFASYITGTELIIDGGQLASKYSTWTEENATFDGNRWARRDPGMG